VVFRFLSSFGVFFIGRWYDPPSPSVHEGTNCWVPFWKRRFSKGYRYVYVYPPREFVQDVS